MRPRAWLAGLARQAGLVAALVVLSALAPVMAQDPEDGPPNGWDLAVTLDPESGYVGEGVVLAVRLANLGTEPAPVPMLDIAFAIGGELFRPVELIGYVGVEEDWLALSEFFELGPFMPGEVRVLDLMARLPDEALAALDTAETRRITVRVATRYFYPVMTFFTPPPTDVDASNNTAIAGLDPLPTGNGPGDLPDLLPWPPPEASSRLVLDPERVRRELEDAAEGATLGLAGDLLEAALIEDGHRDIGFLGVPGDGFALITGLEQVDENAVPLTEGRYSNTIMVDPTRAASPGAWLQDLINALFFAPQGHFRVLVFVVTDVAVSEDPSIEINPDILENWEARSVAALPTPLRDLPFGPEHRITVLVYEFVKESDLALATLTSEHSVQAHLANSRLSRFLPGE